jgi:hypothetical protein
MLDLCVKAGIKPFLLRMPESPAFRQIYPTAADAAIDTYLDGIESEYGIPFVDARTWIDESGFEDGHHLDPAGAAQFTVRFGAELPRLVWKR